MEIMYLLIAGTLFFLGLTIKIFYWAVNSGQFDDLETEGHRILFDDDAPVEKLAGKAAPQSEVNATPPATDHHDPHLHPQDPVVKSSQP